VAHRETRSVVMWWGDPRRYACADFVSTSNLKI